MIIKDRVYGEFEIEDVLIELIASKPVQRLKGIHQGGASYLVNPKWDNSRYDHSVGVMLLIRKLGGSLEEQIAGLLHDISHTAFSHVIDFVLENEKEDYHEEIYRSIVEESEIPNILKKYGYDYKEILLDEEQWTLLEQPLPQLCVDRIDYTLRDLLHHGTLTEEEVHKFVQSLQVIEGIICTCSIKNAEWFVATYHKLVFDYFMHPLNIYANDSLAKVLRLSIEKSIITLKELLKEDEEVIKILRECSDEEIGDLLNKINSQIKIEENTKDYNIHRKNKLRIVDPLVIEGDKLVKASEISSFICDLNEKGKVKAETGTYIKII